MELKPFSSWIIEADLKPGMVFKSKDKDGDLSGKLLFVSSIKNDEVVVAFPGGDTASSTIENLNIDPKSIRAYNPAKDPKFK
jgi:hypothetical protein